MSVIGDITSKKCRDQCPNCGAYDEVSWGEIVAEDVIYHPGDCLKCGCHFHQYYDYADTEFEVGVVPRIKCPYPLNEFYNYMDEVPTDTRVSTPEDCKKCKEPINDEDCRFCLISTENGSKCFFDKDIRKPK